MKACECSIPAGMHFLSGTSIKYLRKTHRKENDPKAVERRLSYMMRKEDMSIRQIMVTQQAVR